MATTITLQGFHSRNCHDWTYIKTATGRHCFQANERAVCRRIGYLVDYLYEYPNSNIREMAAHLQTIGRSYTENDVSQPIRQMIKHKIVKRIGTGRYSTYKLTPRGRQIWNAANKEWK